MPILCGSNIEYSQNSGLMRSKEKRKAAETANGTVLSRFAREKGQISKSAAKDTHKYEGVCMWNYPYSIHHFEIG